MDRIVNNARIIAELARLFPSEPLSSIHGVLDMPIIDKNNAMWYGQGAGLIAEHSRKQTDPIVSLSPEPLWDADVERLKNDILYAMRQVSIDEGDMSEGQLTEWLMGNKGHFVAISLRQLIESKQIIPYTITEHMKMGKGMKSAHHVFYTLAENKGKDWGTKQFKDASTLTITEGAQVAEIETTDTIN